RRRHGVLQPRPAVLVARRSRGRRVDRDPRGRHARHLHRPPRRVARLHRRAPRRRQPSITPISVPTGYVVPTAPVQRTVPDAPASTSVSTFSVSITNSGVPSSTCPPSWTSTSTSVASVLATDARGMRTVKSATAPLHRLLGGRGDARRVRVDLRLEH